MPTIGPAFEPLPSDPAERADVLELRERTAGPARPRRHPRLQPLVPARRRCSACWRWSRSAWRGGWSCERGPEGRLLVGGAIVASLALVGVYLAAGGSSYAPAKTQDPCKPRPWRNPQRPRADRRAVLALGPRRRRLPARGLARDAGAGAGDAAGARALHASATGSTTRSWRKAIRAGLLRAVDDAEERRRPQPAPRRPLRATAPAHPARTSDRTGPRRRARCSTTSQSFLGPAEGLLEQFLP